MGGSRKRKRAKEADPKTAGRAARDRAELVERAIQSIEEKLRSNEVKATLGDFIRLLQLQKELQVDHPREIKITWVEGAEEKSVSD